MTERAFIRGLALRYAPLGLVGLVLIWHSLRYGFVTDDAYISFVYSRNLAAHGELAFNPGLPPVEGYTNFLWTFVLGVAYRVGLPIEATALVLGTGFALATLVVVHRLAVRLIGEVPRAGAALHALGPALLALSAGYACWSSGGLETQMFTFWVVLAVGFASDDDPRRFRHAGWSLALAAMTRPEGLLCSAIIGLHRLAWNLIVERRVRPTRDELVAAAWLVGLWAPWFAWRWWYYGWPLPNTAYVKAAGEAAPGYDAKMHEAGRYYVMQWLRQTGLVFGFPLVVAGWLVAPRRSAWLRFGSLAAPLTGLYLVYTIRVGGDFMGLHRFVMPLFPLCALGVALGVRRLAGLAPARLATAAGLGLVAILIAGFGWRQLALTARSTLAGNYQSDRGIDTPAFLAVYAHDRALIGRAMRPCFRPDDFAIYGGAGAKPFFAELRGIDVYGLVSERIGHEVPRTRPRAGHNKWGPDRLLLEHDPTFVFSCYELARTPARPRMPCDLAFWKRAGYEPVTMHIPGLRERGEYYTFLAKTSRAFTCPGVVR